MSTSEIESFIDAELAARLKLSSMSTTQREALFEWGMRMLMLGQPTVGEIAEIKYGGRLVILDDGTRFEVEEGDGDVAELWGEGQRVIVIDGEMYKLDEFEKIDVTEDA